MAPFRLNQMPLKISFLLWVTLVLLQPLSVFGAAITDIRFWSAPDHTRVVLDLTKSVQFISSSQESPPRCEIELTGITSFPPKREVEVGDKYLLKISLTDLGRGKARLILHQKVPLQMNLFTLKPDLGKTHRLVIDLIDVKKEKEEQEERQREKEMRAKGTKIVVIDPGHGGEDPGAVGPGKTMEKEVVLKVGQKMISLLHQQPGIKAFLTRKGDYFIPLEQRVRMARDCLLYTSPSPRDS